MSAEAARIDMTESDYKQFIDLVERMRQMQKDFFTYRQRESLQASKELEKQVDRFIEAQKTGDLFT